MREPEYANFADRMKNYMFANTTEDLRRGFYPYNFSESLKQW